MEHRTAGPPTRAAADWPLYWFAELEQARASGDCKAAAAARRELRRLGVEVRYRRAGEARRAR